jgi:hypothetical protein
MQVVEGCPLPHYGMLQFEGKEKINCSAKKAIGK